MDNVKIIRMQTGEDIMASMKDEGDNETVVLTNPMRIVFRRMPTGQTIFMMMPWLPVELIKEDSALIYTSDIITVVDPKDSMIEYYGNTVNRNILENLNSDEMIDQLLKEQEDDVEQVEEITEELTKQIQDFKNKMLH